MLMEGDEERWVEAHVEHTDIDQLSRLGWPCAVGSMEQRQMYLF